MEVEGRTDRETTPGVEEAGKTAVEVFRFGNGILSLETRECTTQLSPPFGNSGTGMKVWI